MFRLSNLNAQVLCYWTGLVLVCACNSALAGTEMYVCTGKDGVRTYQNSDGGAGCVPLNLNPITVVPSPPSRPLNKPQSAVRSGTGSGDAKYDQSNDYLSYDAKADRLKILQEELRLEESKLDGLKNEYKDGHPDRLGSERNYQKYLDRTAQLKDQISTSQENISVIKKEIERMQK
ncbi:DUF4124 domain-containing protein [Limnobacter sp.]|uniref:DUF4124 domain-containing protein n=1 Tax=Limnobacter sp. TaxID=2003368 RepID=UPI00258386EE|nr:DUF4124 domain-containing protein [Limnobacter sp.]